MKNKKDNTLIIELSDEEYRLLLEAAFNKGYCCAEELAKHILMRKFGGGKNETKPNHNS